MIEALALVAQVSDDDVTVTGRAQSACERCARGEGCGGGLLGKLVKRTGGTLHVNHPDFELHAGDVVVLGITEKSLITAMFEAYALPLLGMIVLAILASLLLPGVDWAAALAGAAGLVGGALLGRRLLARGLRGARPRVLRRASAQEMASCATTQ